MIDEYSVLLPNNYSKEPLLEDESFYLQHTLRFRFNERIQLSGFSESPGVTNS